MTQRHSFAVRLLEQVVVRGRAGSKARLILHHLDTEMVLGLVEAAPEMLTVGLVTQLFDVASSAAGRRNLANVVFALRKAEKSRKGAKEEEN